ncbi:uncharacterized protein LTR77_009361 [Saxophila tyrrhenica]|uniref:Transcription factor CBF/NF-Y/archaeal histone domain-containing protein n=1 Tax=Saxophila tyrrhenica TaxID=1690608 RepID=A0AAV9P2S2_9PEZI|nr:hypothetical protein LTR77_009361 [Saxophila tyrrhenica]
MPYNNTPIQPSKEVTGTVALPLARVKKIIATDDDISNCSNNAAFMITVAAEMFLQHLVEQSHNVVKSEKKPRRNIQYRDIANAVARVENLEFLTDVVPKTTTFRQHKANERRAQQQAEARPQGEAAEGQAPGEQRPGDQMRIDEMPSRAPAPEGPPTTSAYPQVVIPTSELEVEAQATNGASKGEGGDRMDVDDEVVVHHSGPGADGHTGR